MEVAGFFVLKYATKEHHRLLGFALGSMGIDVAIDKLILIVRLMPSDLDLQLQF
jgi:hypothetical protein